MIDRAASLQPARAPKQQIPLAPCKGRGRFPAHEEDRVCLPSGSVGSILGKAMSTTDFWNTVNQTNKQTNKRHLFNAQSTFSTVLQGLLLESDLFCFSARLTSINGRPQQRHLFTVK